MPPPVFSQGTEESRDQTLTSVSHSLIYLCFCLKSDTIDDIPFVSYCTHTLSHYLLPSRNICSALSSVLRWRRTSYSSLGTSLDLLLGGPSVLSFTFRRPTLSGVKDTLLFFPPVTPISSHPSSFPRSPRPVFKPKRRFTSSFRNFIESVPQYVREKTSLIVWYRVPI